MLYTRVLRDGGREKGEVDELKEMDRDDCNDGSGENWLQDGSGENWLQLFSHEIAQIEALPFVKGEVGVVVSDVKANLNKVYVAVWCCWEKSRQSFKQVYVACDEERRLTHLEAARELFAKLMREHGGEGHSVHPMAAERRARLPVSAVQPDHGVIGQRPSVVNAVNVRDPLQHIMLGRKLQSEREAVDKARVQAGKREHMAGMSVRAAKEELKEAIAAREAAEAAL